MGKDSDRETRARYARIPEEVLMDRKLSLEAYRIYGLIAMNVYQGSVSVIGLRKLGKKMGRSPNTVRKRIEELVKAGYIRVSDTGERERLWYVLTSPVFAQKQGQVEEVHINPDGSKRMVSCA